MSTPPRHEQVRSRGCNIFVAPTPLLLSWSVVVVAKVLLGSKRNWTGNLFLSSGNVSRLSENALLSTQHWLLRWPLVEDVGGWARS